MVARPPTIGRIMRVWLGILFMAWGLMLGNQFALIIGLVLLLLSIRKT